MALLVWVRLVCVLHAQPMEGILIGVGKAGHCHVIVISDECVPQHGECHLSPPYPAGPCHSHLS